MERNISDEECDNYYRLITLIVNIGTWTIREVFKKHTGDDIASFVENHKTEIDQLKKKRVLKDPHCKLLDASPDLGKFDISLLVILIRNICTSVTAPNAGWNKFLVPSSDTTVGGYINRIRNIRNEIVGHSSDTRVSNDLFNKTWAVAEKSLKELAAHVSEKLRDKIAEEIEITKSVKLTTDSISNLQAELKKWKIEANHMFDKLQQTADEQNSKTEKMMEELLVIRIHQQTAPVVPTYILCQNTEFKQVKDALENGGCKALELNTIQQQLPRALPPIVIPNAQTEEGIVVFSEQQDVEHMKLSPETKKKIEDTETKHRGVHPIGPSSEISKQAVKSKEEQQQPGIAGAYGPIIDDVEKKLAER